MLMKRFLSEWQMKVRLSHRNGKKSAKTNRDGNLAGSSKDSNDLLLSSVKTEMSKPRTAKSARRKRPNARLQIAGLA
jgi:hypothetical protein